MTHKTLQNQLLKLASRLGARLFQNNVGTGWVGRITSRTAGTITLNGYRILEAGLGKGSGDLIGFVPIEITPDMVGRKVAVFLSVEVKTGSGRMTKEQRSWMDVVNKMGGIAIEARTVEDLNDKIGLFKKGAPQP